MLDEYQQNAISHAAQMAAATIAQDAGVAILNIADDMRRPSVLYRPALTVDGNQWCALYGRDLVEGVAGFGDSPALAMADFDRNWCAALKPR